MTSGTFILHRTTTQKDPCEYTKIPFRNPDRNWQNFQFSHSTVRIDFKKIWQKAKFVYPDRNQAKFDNPLPHPDKNWLLKGESNLRTHALQMTSNITTGLKNICWLFLWAIYTCYNWEFYTNIWHYNFFSFSHTFSTIKPCNHQRSMKSMTNHLHLMILIWSPKQIKARKMGSNLPVCQIWGLVKKIKPNLVSG